jgi:hypothetical protein
MDVGIGHTDDLGAERPGVRDVQLDVSGRIDDQGIAIAHEEVGQGALSNPVELDQVIECGGGGQ